MSAEQELIAVRARLAELEEKVEFLYKHLGLVTDIKEVDAQIIAAIRSMNLIEAIKLYRQNYNVGLAEAKDAVEKIKRNLNL